MTYSLMLVTLLLSGCFNPDPNKANLICDRHRPECLDPAMVCNLETGRCEFPELPGIDGGTEDLEIPSLQRGQAPGCAGGTGWTHRDYPNIAACPGPWVRPNFYNACGTGWRLCTAAPEGFCAMVPAFFAAGIAAAQSSPWPPDANLRCTWDGSTETSPRGVAGCGMSPHGGTYPATSPRCGGLLSVQNCGDRWHCAQSAMPGDQDFASVWMDNQEDGRLCCKG